MRAIKRSIADARAEREARERGAPEARERCAREACERDARERDARERGEREARERGARDLRERLDRAARERELLDAIRAVSTVDTPASELATREHVTELTSEHVTERTSEHVIDPATCEHVTELTSEHVTELTSEHVTELTSEHVTELTSEHVIDPATCEHVTRELTTRIDTRPFRRTDIEPLRCEPCPRVIPSRRLFDGSILQQFQCDGTCVRDERRARDKARVHAEQHEQQAQHVRVASRHELGVQLAIIAVLAVLAAMWVVLAAREASADTRREDATSTRRDDTQRDDANTRRDDARPRIAERDGDVDDDEAIDVAAPPVRDAPFGAPVVAPPISEVLAAAYRTAGLDRDLGSGFVRRARLAGLVPLLTVRTGRNTSWRDEELDVARGVTIEVRATWRLDRLVFDGRELQVAALDGARRRERRRLAARVIQVYFAWKRAARSTGIQPRSSAVAEEAAAELDDLTEGWFTEAREGQRP